MQRGPVIRFVDVRKAFGDRVILDGVSFTITPGEVFFLIGASGVGKSVALKHLVGLLAPDAGEVWVEGIEVSRLGEDAWLPVRKRVAMVFQHATLFDSMTCLENVALPLRKHRRLSPRDAGAEALRLLQRVHLGEMAERYPAELGDGLRKGVAIARALALEPAYVLFDEPTTSLDPVSARRVDRLIRELADGLGVTCVVVSHDLASIFSIADRIAMLYRGQVRILGTPPELLASPDAVVAQFVRGQADGPMEV